MKTLGMLSVVVMMGFGWITSYGQESEPEVPGDHFSLEGALELFKKSESPEEFERLLNSADSEVNNLDLNGDGYIDYIRVFDRYEGNVHAFIIQAVLSQTENQDIAVIELEKLANGRAVLQIIGDEDVYGIETIIEPTREVRTYAGTTATTTVVNVWTWPSVQYVYGPYYAGWYSPWGWHARPVWWRSWRPVAYVHYYPRWRPYRPYYAVCQSHRVTYAHRIYRPYRTTSVIYHDRHRDRISRYRDDYRNGRIRDDERRYSDRSSSENGRHRTDIYAPNGRSSTRRDAIISSDLSDRRQRNISRDRQTSPAESERDGDRNRSRQLENPNIQRRSIDRNADEIQNNSSTRNREDFLNTKPTQDHNNFELRQRVIRSNDSRHKSLERQNIQHQSLNTDRSTRTESQRSSSLEKKDELSNRQAEHIRKNFESHQQVPTPSETRNRSLDRQQVQQRSIGRERTTPTETQRNTSTHQRQDFSNGRSGADGNNAGVRRQMTRPTTVERNSSSGNSNTRYRSSDRTGGTRSGEIKRGRH